MPDDSSDKGKESSRPTYPPGKKHLLKRLTEDLLHTYKDINKKYYEKKKKRNAEAAKSRGNYDYEVRVHEKLNNRYRVMEAIGKGSFGQVVRAYDEKEQKSVAVKIIKNKEAFRTQARTEIALLKKLNQHDPGDRWSIVRLLSTFEHHGHFCLVFEMLSFNLYQLLRRTHFKGVSLNLIRKFARQILKTLAYLSLEDVNIVHCDLKPENILFVQPYRSAIKVIDFGSSCLATQPAFTYIQSRFYRAPEVILGLPYSTPIDMWSLGCILAELHTGLPLFSGRDQQDQMNRFVALLGQPPKHMLENGRKTHHFFEFVRVAPGAGTGDSASDSDSDSDGSQSDGESNSDGSSDASDSEMSSEGTSSKASGAVSAASSRRKQRRHRTKRPKFKEYYKLHPFMRKGSSPVHTSLAAVLGVNTQGPSGRRQHEPTGHTHTHYRQFMDLVQQMLEYDPAKRVKPMQALNHPFLRGDLVGSKSSGSGEGSMTRQTDSVGAGAGAAEGSSGTEAAAATTTASAARAEHVSRQAPVVMNYYEATESAVAYLTAHSGTEMSKEDQAKLKQVTLTKEPRSAEGSLASGPVSVLRHGVKAPSDAKLANPTLVLVVAGFPSDALRGEPVALFHEMQPPAPATSGTASTGGATLPESSSSAGGTGSVH